MTVPVVLKIVGALLLLMCAALPFEAFDSPARDNWLGILLLTWPLLALAVLQWRPKGNVGMAVRILELLLVAFSLFVVWNANELEVAFAEIFGMAPPDHALGRDFAYAALSLYGVGAIWSDAVSMHRWRKTAATDGACD